MRTAKNPAGQTCYFEEKEHKYFVGDVVLTSVTTFVDSFFPQFDAETQAVAYAKKNGRTPEYWMSEWDALAESASRLGDVCHGYAESLATGKPFDVGRSLSPRELKYMGSVEEAWIKLQERFTFVQAEFIVFSLRLGLAGMIDLIMKDRFSQDLVIFDWKTSFEIEKTNMWQSGFEPVAHLEDCNFNHYQLQTNSYKAILLKEYRSELAGNTSGQIRMNLIHIKEDGVGWYKCADLSSDVNTMLEWV